MILVTGATGLTGGAVVRHLAARKVPIRALVRNPARAQSLAALPDVEIVEGDMARPETLAAPLRGIDRAILISSSDPAMLDVQTNFIMAAKQAGIGHVVKLSGIIPELTSLFRFARMHGEAEKRLEASGVPFTHLRAGEFMHSYFRQVPSILARGAMFLPMADARIASIDIDDIAAVAADVLTTPGHEGKIYPLTGPEALTMSEVADKLAAVTGKPVKYVNVAPEDATRVQLAAGMPDYLAAGIAELFAERRKGKESQVYPTMERVFGRRPTSFDQFASRYAAVFRGEAPPPR